jgi:hypothetical protein
VEVALQIALSSICNYNIQSFRAYFTNSFKSVLITSLVLSVDPSASGENEVLGLALNLSISYILF